MDRGKKCRTQAKKDWFIPVNLWISRTRIANICLINPKINEAGSAAGFGIGRMEDGIRREKRKKAGKNLRKTAKKLLTKAYLLSYNWRDVQFLKEQIVSAD